MEGNRKWWGATAVSVGNELWPIHAYHCALLSPYKRFHVYGTSDIYLCLK